MKKPLLAFVLSFLLPGAGLAYFGKWKWASINLLAVLALGAVLVFALPEKIFAHYIQFAAFGCGGGSGGLARTLAIQMNHKAAGSENA